MVANFIQRSRHDSIYYFRRRIPNDLHARGLPRQIVRSLHTADRQEAAVRGRAHKRSIKTSHRNPTEALVDDGLKPAESVVVYPPDALKDGADVTPAKPGNG